MVIGCCEECKNIDLIEENQDNTCSKCGGRFVSLGISVEEWNELDNDGMFALVEKALAPKKPVIKQLQQPTAPTLQGNTGFPRNGYSPQNHNTQQHRATRLTSGSTQRLSGNTTVGRILIDTPLIPIICIGLCIWDWFSDPPALTYIFSFFIIGLSIFSIVKKCRIWGLSIAAIVIAALCIIITVIGTALGLTEEKKNRDVSEKKSPIEVSQIDDSKDVSKEQTHEPQTPKQILTIGGLNFDIPGELKYVGSNYGDSAHITVYGSDDENRMFVLLNTDESVKIADSLSEDEIKKRMEDLSTICDESVFVGGDAITSKTNDIIKSGTSGDIVYSLRTYEGIYKSNKVSIGTLSFLNHDKAGLLVYLSDSNKYPNDSTFDEIVNSSVIDISGSESASDRSITDSSGVDPELKAALDDYEAFMDKYIAFMKKYESDPGNAISMIGEYTEIVAQYAEYVEKIDAYEKKKNEMSTEDWKYYLDVTNRVEKKMIDVIQ